MTQPIPTETQVSAGGVAFRREGQGVLVALISVGEQRRWQLPKGLVAEGETHEQAALREVREEAGIHTELIAPLDQAEYWYYATRHGRRTRYHKFVHFFLLRYTSGDVLDHDHEVNEARWFAIEEALQKLYFDSDRHMMQLAGGKIAEIPD